jgi:hypothetical protein
MRGMTGIEEVLSFPSAERANTCVGKKEIKKK